MGGVQWTDRRQCTGARPCSSISIGIASRTDSTGQRSGTKAEQRSSGACLTR